MKVEETYLKGCYVISPNIFKDERGYFYESFNVKAFKKATDLDVNFVQDNISKSSKGVLRGLHFQKGDDAQAKLVQVLKGSVLDVCVDLRSNSKTFGKHFSIVLDSEKHQQLYIPRGFAHGFYVLEDDTVFSYKCDRFYNKEAEAGIFYKDEQLDIDWGVSNELILSEKDKALPTLEGFLKLNE